MLQGSDTAIQDDFPYAVKIGIRVPLRANLRGEFVFLGQPLRADHAGFFHRIGQRLFAVHVHVAV